MNKKPTPDDFRIAAEIITRVVAKASVHSLPKEKGHNPKFTITSQVGLEEIFELLDEYKGLKDD